MGKSRKRQKLLPTAEAEAKVAWPTFESTQNDWHKKWMVFSDTSLLSNFDEKLWIALGHVEPESIKSKKPVHAMRDALQNLGLAWVCNNTTPLRRTMVQHYDMAQKFYEENGYEPPKNLHEIPLQKIEVRDWEWTPPKGGVEGIGGIEDDIIPDSVTKQIHTSIRNTGMAIIHGAVDKATIKKIQSNIELAKTPTQLSDTSGLGMAGSNGSFYCDIKQSKYLDQVQDIFLKSLKQVECRNEPKPKKYIYLKYSEGGENFAHRDGNDDKAFPYQALLMLSNSNDYDGGEFYVAKRVNAAIDRTCTPKLDAGDLVIFQADKDGGYDHGMKKVTRGEREAIGLLQPVPAK